MLEQHLWEFKATLYLSSIFLSSIVRSFNRSFDLLFVCLFDLSFIRSIVCLFDLSFVRSIVCLFV